MPLKRLRTVPPLFPKDPTRSSNPLPYFSIRGVKCWGPFPPLNCSQPPPPPPFHPNASMQLPLFSLTPPDNVARCYIIAVGQCCQVAGNSVVLPGRRCPPKWNSSRRANRVEWVGNFFHGMSSNEKFR